MTHLSRRFLWLIAIIIVVVSVGKLRLAIIQAVKIPSRIVSSLPIAVKNISGYNSLRSENEKLKITVDFLTNQLATTKDAIKENEHLHALLAFKKASPYELIGARVVGRSASLSESAILIDKGSDDAIAQDMPVITPLGLVGRVARTGKTISWVILLTDTDFRASCITVRTREPGLLQGQGGARCIIKHLAPDSDVVADDELITSGFGGLFPKGIQVGRLVKVNPQKNQLSKLATVKPSADLRHLEEAFVIINSK